MVILKKLTDLEYPGMSIGVVESGNIEIHARGRRFAWLGEGSGFKGVKDRDDLVQPGVQGILCGGEGYFGFG